VAIIAGLGDSEMTARMKRYVACRVAAAVCREKAETNFNRRDYWLAEAQKWESRAEDSEGAPDSYSDQRYADK
jgi:hypothetical protein